MGEREARRRAGRNAHIDILRQVVFLDRLIASRRQSRTRSIDRQSVARAECMRVCWLKGDHGRVINERDVVTAKRDGWGTPVRRRVKRAIASGPHRGCEKLTWFQGFETGGPAAAAAGFGAVRTNGRYRVDCLANDLSPSAQWDSHENRCSRLAKTLRTGQVPSGVRDRSALQISGRNW